jgi:hypothetical protein
MSSCNHCKNPATYRCNRCLAVCYCGRECQRADYPTHKTGCRLSSGTKTETSPGIKADYFSSKTETSPKAGTKPEVETSPKAESKPETKTLPKSGTLPKSTPGVDKAVKALLANLYASQSPEDIVKAMSVDSPFKRQKDALSLRLQGGVAARKLFLKALTKRPLDINTTRGFVLIYSTMEALERDLDSKEKEGDLLDLKPIAVDKLLSLWPSKQNIEQYRNDPNMFYICVCTHLPLSSLRSDLKDMTICHCVIVLDRKVCFAS